MKSSELRQAEDPLPVTHSKRVLFMFEDQLVGSQRPSTIAETLDLIWQPFEMLIDRRLKSQVCTTEDGLRYTFFAALLQAGLAPEQVELEAPHPRLQGAQIDTIIKTEGVHTPSPDNPVAAIEFKYNRRSANSRSPVTQKAGRLFADFGRLLRLDHSYLKYLIVLVDKRFWSYYTKPLDRLALYQVFVLKRGEAVTLDGEFKLQQKTFRKVMRKGGGKWICPGVITCQFDSGYLTKDHVLKVFSIEKTDANPGVAGIEE